MSSKNYEGSGYSLDLDLLTISYQSPVSYPRRRGLGTIPDKSTLLQKATLVGCNLNLLFATQVWVAEEALIHDTGWGPF